MNKKIISRLVDASYIENTFDEVKVHKIVSLLKRKELKLYIKALKQYEQEHTVIVEVPQGNEDAYKQLVKEIFSKKNVIYKVNPSLILGIKIIDNDIIYEMDLQSIFDDILTKMKQSYD